MKKRYLIVIALVLVGFLTFSTFANPSEESGENNNTQSTNQLKEVEETKPLVQDNIKEEIEEEEVTFTPVVRQPVVRRPQVNNQVTDNPVIETPVQEDNSYEIALAAVEKTEETYEEVDYNTAKALTFHVKDLDKQSALDNRLEDVLESMKLIEQVYELAVKVKNSTTKEELISARSYEEANKIISKVTNLLDENLKKELNDKINEVLNKLNDIDAPFIDIDKDAVLKEVTKLDIKDVSNYTITLTKDGEKLEGIQNGYMMLDGVYELNIVDSSFNETNLTFTIDTTPAVINLAGTVGLNKNEYIVNSGDVVTVEDIMAEVVDNIDGTIKIKPLRAHLLISNIASENKYNYDFTNGFETNYHGRYNLYYEYTDKAGNKSEAVMLLVMKDKVAPTITIKGTDGRNKNELRVNQDDVVTLEDVIAISNDNTEGEKELYPSSITRSYPKEMKKANHSYDATNGFDTSIPGYYTLTFISKDKAGNTTKKVMLLVVKQNRLPKIKNGKTALYANITLINEPFFNEIDIDKDILIEGNGYTVNHIVTSESNFGWTENGTRPTMGSMFASKNGEKITVNNVKLTGTTHSISLGQYRSDTYTNYNTEFNNVNIINLKVASYDNNRGQAVIAFGNVTFNNTNIYGTSRTPLETAPLKPLYDLTLANGTTKINGGKIGTIYTLDGVKVEIKNAKIDTITARCKKASNGELIIDSGTTVNKISVKKNDTVIIIKSGAVVDTIDYENRKVNTIIIEDGAIVKNHINKK